jgi:hypothetical protein
MQKSDIITSLCFFIALAALLISGCSISPTNRLLERDNIISFGQELRIDDANMTIEFTDIISDARCPRLLDCLWEGMAEIKLRVTLPNQNPVEAVVGIRPSGDANIYPELAAYVGEYRINLVALDPYPENDRPIPRENYIAALEVSRINPDHDGLVQFSYRNPADLMLDPFVINTAGISENVLTLSVSYGGGCETHDFLLYMSPPVFMESFPAQASLYLHHDGHDDACDAYLTEELHFDLNPIRNLYYRSYGSYDNIILNIYRYYQDQPGEKIAIMYSTE